MKKFRGKIKVAHKKLNKLMYFEALVCHGPVIAIAKCLMLVGRHYQEDKNMEYLIVLRSARIVLSGFSEIF